MFRYTALFLFPCIAMAYQTAVSPEEAAKMVDKNCLLEMKVGSAGLDKNKVNLFLNSKEDFKEKGNFTVMVRGPAAKALKEKHKYDDPSAFFKGKMIRVEGKVSLYKENPQIVLEKEDKITLLEDKK